MQSNNKKKICIVVSSLGKGGAERSSALLSKMLYNLGYDVHIVSVLNDIDYDYSGTLLNLGELKDKKDGFLARLHRLNVFKNYLRENQFDYIIDNRSRPTNFKEIIISKWIYKRFKVIYVVRSYKLRTYFSRSKLISKWIYGEAYKVVSVSNEIERQIENDYSLSNLETIYNPVDFSAFIKLSKKDVTVKEDYILFYGRLLDNVKNVSLLIEAYRLSQLSSKDIKLVILGDGADKNKLIKLVETNNLTEHVQFIPFTENPFPYIKNARFTVLSSHYEGFPRVLLESLAIGTPVISVDCKSGPKEIIVNGQNGLLVENYNPQALVQAMDSFIFDETLYANCKNNAEDSVKQFSLEPIAKQWQQLLQ